MEEPEQAQAAGEPERTLLAGEPERARMAGMDLVSVSPGEPNLEEIFVELIERAEETVGQNGGLEQDAGRRPVGAEIRG